MAGTLHLTAASSSWLQPKASRLKWHSVKDFSNPEHCTSFMWTGPIPGERHIRQNVNVKKEFFTTVVHFLDLFFNHHYFIIILKKRAIVRVDWIGVGLHNIFLKQKFVLANERNS